MILRNVKYISIFKKNKNKNLEETMRFSMNHCDVTYMIRLHTKKNDGFGRS